PRDLIQLRRHDPNRVENVDDAMTGEILRLGQGGHGDGAGLPGKRQPRDIDRLRRLHVRPERHLKACEVARHGADVPQQLLAIENEARRWQVGELHVGGVPEAVVSVGTGHVATSSMGSTGRGICRQAKRDRIGLVRPGASTSITSSWRKNSSKPPRKWPRDLTTTTRAAAMSRPNISKNTGSAHCTRLPMTTTVKPPIRRAADNQRSSVLLA